MDGWAEINDDAGPKASHLRYLEARIWDVANTLRDSSERGSSEEVVLSLLLLRRLECLGQAEARPVPLSLSAVRSTLDGRDQPHDKIPPRLGQVLDGLRFWQAVRDVSWPEALHMAISSIASLDLSRETVPPEAMIDLVGRVIRRYQRGSDVEPYDTTTPPSLARLLAELLVPDLPAETHDLRVLDPACGTGTLLVAARRRIAELSHAPGKPVTTFGQDVNLRAATVARLLALIAPDPAMDIHEGDSLTAPSSFPRADYAVCNPPFGADWKRQRDAILAEQARGSFTAGLPRLSDSQFLFLQRALEAVRPSYGEPRRGRVAILMSGSTLFSGEPGSGESEIRRHLVERDLLDCIVALPQNLLFHTSIPVFVWLLAYDKPLHRRGRVQLIDASSQEDDNKRKARGLRSERIVEISRAYAEMRDEPGFSRVVTGKQLGYLRITIDRPLRLRFQLTEDGKRRIADGRPHLLPVMRAMEDAFGSTAVDWRRASEWLDGLTASGRWTLTKPEREAVRDVFTERDPDAEPELGELDGTWRPDPELRTYERVPLTEDMEKYFRREVLPHVPDAWVSGERVGYDFSFGPLFPQPPSRPRSLQDINDDLRASKNQLDRLFDELIS
jgi:type I restriction enzyme M protein